LNKWYQSGDQAYIIVASAMVLVMIPGLGFLYSGLARRKSALSMIWACMASGSIITFQWYFWGYSLAFSPTATNGFIGDLNNFGLRNALGNPSPGSPLIPDLLYAFYQVRNSLLAFVFFRLSAELILDSYLDAILCRHCSHHHGCGG
jgi:ammonium transporter, Amt family